MRSFNSRVQQNSSQVLERGITKMGGYKWGTCMRDISFEDCVEFQDCFLVDGNFSPFELVEDFRSYYPRVLLGGIGGLINLSCKRIRSANIYDEEIEDICGNVFIYLLLFGRMLEIHDRKAVLGRIRGQWNEPIAELMTENDYYNECRKMMKQVDRFLDPGKDSFYQETYFHEIFVSIRRVSKFVTTHDWQKVINNFHVQVIQKHTEVSRYTLDGLYRGIDRIDLGKLLGFIEKVELRLPPKRIDFLERSCGGHSAQTMERRHEGRRCRHTTTFPPMFHEAGVRFRNNLVKTGYFTG